MSAKVKKLVEVDGQPVVEEIERPSWFQRRIFTYAVLAFCFGSLTYLMAFAQDTELNRSIANGLMLLCGMVVSTFIGGAVWDDKNVMRELGKEAYTQRRAPTPEELNELSPPPDQGG